MGSGGRTKIPSDGTGSDDDDETEYLAPAHWDYGDYAAPGEEPRRRAAFARRDELEVVARMLARHHGFELGRARALVWAQPGALEGLSRRGRPPKPHLLHAADIADEMLSRGRDVRWDVVHRSFVALNEPEEMRPFEFDGQKSVEPRDSEDWQRAVRRIRRRLRVEAAALARQFETEHPG